MTKNILFITAEYSDQNCGGAGVYAYELSKSLSKNGIYVHVLTAGREKKVIRQNSFLTIEYVPTLFLPALRTPIFWFNTKRVVKRLIKKKKVDVVHSNNTAGALVVTDLPFVTTIQHPAIADNEAYFFIQRLLNQLDIIFEKKMVLKSSRVIATSAQSSELIKKIYPQIINKISLIPIGVDTNFFHPVQNAKKLICSKYGINEKNLMFFFPGGNRGRRKGLEVFLTAIDCIKDVNFACIVSGESREIGWNKYIQNKLNNNKYRDKIIFCKELEYKDLPLYYSAADLTVFPSLFEGFGLPILESLACNTPVIASDTGEARNIIRQKENGYLVDVAEATKIAEIISYIDKNKKVLYKLTDHARTSVIKEYSWTSVARKYLHFYEESIK